MDVLTRLLENVPGLDTSVLKMLQRSLFALLPAALAAAFPQETGLPTITAAPSSTSAAASSLITTAPGLTCSDGSTVLFTLECTYGYPISYCHSDPPPISCGVGFFPGTYHPGKTSSRAGYDMPAFYLPVV